MRFLTYVRESVLSIIYLFVILLVLDLILLSSDPLEKTSYEIFYLNILIIAISIIFIIIGFIRWKIKYQEFKKALDTREDINLSVPEGQDFFSKLIRETVNHKNLEIDTKVQKLKKENDEINEYITKWTHEIKIPISVSELIAERIESENQLIRAREISSDIRTELERIKFLTNQVLYAARSNSYYEDLLVNELNLEILIKSIIKKNSYTFISKKIDLELGDLDFNILSDKKWLSYIIEQMLNNSSKYIEEDGKIKIYASQDNETIRLSIEDNGIGILSQDLSRVFDKGFTGNNGRKVAKSTGMGLYYSNKMAEKMNHKLEVESAENKYTRVSIIFYKLSDYYNVTKM